MGISNRGQATRSPCPCRPSPSHCPCRLPGRLHFHPRQGDDPTLRQTHQPAT